MYRVYADDILIHDDQALDDIKAINPKLTLQESAAGSFTFTLTESNPGYDYIQRFTTIITVKEFDNEIWSGRVIQEDEDYWKNRRFTCEGELAYLNDTLQLPHEYHNISVDGFLNTLLTNHNQMVSDEKKFYVGYVDSEISLLPKDNTDDNNVPEYIQASGTYDPNQHYYQQDGNGNWVEVGIPISYNPGNPPTPIYPDVTGMNLYIKNPQYTPPEENIPEYIEASKPYNPNYNTYYAPNENDYYRRIDLESEHVTGYNGGGAVLVYNDEIHIINQKGHKKWNGSEWVPVSTLPYTFQNGCAVAYDGSIHLLGGDGYEDFTVGANAGSNPVPKYHYKWNVSTGWVKNSTPLPYNFIHGSAVVAYDNEIHIFGGLDSSNNPVKKHYYWSKNTNTWIADTSLPYGFAKGNAVYINQHIHILGGSSSKTKHYKLDTQNKKWVSVSVLPYNFYNGAAGVLPNEIHIVGGTSNTTKHYIYTDDQWVEASELPYNFENGGVAVLNYSINYGVGLGNSKLRLHLVGGRTAPEGGAVIAIVMDDFYVWDMLGWVPVYTYPSTVYVKNTEYSRDKDRLYRFTNYETTLECIYDKLINRVGGHIRVRKVMGKKYIDYYKNEAETSSQIVQFGVNLLDFTKNWDLTDFATVIIPLGATIEHDENWDGDENHPKALPDYTTVETVNNNSRYVVSQEAFARFGRIEKVVNWDDVSVPKNLLRKAQKYLSDYQFDKMTLVVSAVDLHFINKTEVEGFKLLDNVRILSTPHGLDRYFLVTKITISLDSPESTEYTFGEVTESTLTSMVNK